MVHDVAVPVLYGKAGLLPPILHKGHEAHGVQKAVIVQFATLLLAANVPVLLHKTAQILLDASSYESVN